MNGTYSYRAARLDGGIERGVVSADSRDQAERFVLGRGLFLLDVAEQAAPAGRHRPGASDRDLAVGLEMLGTLLASGLPLQRALAILGAASPRGWGAAVPAIASSIREGSALSSALARSPLHFPPLLIGIIVAGESGGRLADAVKRAAGVSARSATSREALRAALAYPIVLACASVLAIALLAGVVIPRFAAILQDLQQALPVSTRVVLGAAELARAASPPLALALLCVVALWRAWMRGADGRAAWHAALLRMPLVGDVRMASATALLAQSLGALLESGVPIAVALRDAAPAAGDTAIERRMGAAREHVIRGQRLSRALELEGAMTPVALQLLRAGEESGRVPAMLQHAAELEGARSARAVRGAVALLEPALVLFFGGIVAIVAIALLQAVYAVRPGA